MGLLDALFQSDGGQGGGLLDFLRNSGMSQQPQQGLPSDQAQYGQPMNAMAQAPAPIFQQSQPNPMDTAQWPAGPVGAPSQANAQMPPQQPQPVPQAAPASPQAPSGGFGAGVSGFLGNLHTGPIGALIGGVGSAMGMQDPRTQIAVQHANVTAQALRAKGIPEQDIAAAVGNGRTPGDKTLLEALIKQAYPQPGVTSLGSGYVADKNGKITKAFTPDEATPSSIREYEYYTKNFNPTADQQQPMPYDVWSTAKSRAGATNISNNIDMNSGQTYDKQLAEGLGKAHATLANGVEDAQARARDIAAMQGAVDAIQKNGGTTGGLGQQQVLDLKKTINAGMNALGVDKPFNEGDLSDKEFLTKFNRSMAGAQAKGAVGARVTNFEMSNFLKANPGLDMSVTGNQRLLGIQAQMEERNIAVGNAIRDATAEAISTGKKINPVTVQGIIKKYDDEHHIKDVVTGQDLTQSYALPEFQKSETNASMAKSHEENLKTMEKTIGGVTYEQRNGQWYPKK